MLKLALQKHLPREIVWRRKFGMSVPITDWVLGPLAPVLEDLLGPASLARRGLFRAEYVERLRQGQNEPSETRRRRVGERLWALAMLEAWLRVFVDGRGPPAAGLGMKCIHCGTTASTSERPDRTCPHVRQRVRLRAEGRRPLSPTPAFQNAIDAVSGRRQVRWGVEHLYYEVCRRLRKRRYPWASPSCRACS